MAATVHRIVNLRVLCVVPVIGFSFLCLLALSAFGGTVQVPLKDGWRFVKADDPAAGTNLTLGAMSDILDRANRGDTSRAPVFGWAQPGFDDSAWARSAGGFGNKSIMKNHPHAKCATKWETPEIWLRRHFTYTKPAGKILRATIEMFHDEDAEVYLNGELILSAKGYNTNWTSFSVPEEKFDAAVKEGDNVIAVKVIQSVGGQFIDLGLSVDIAK